MITDPSFLPYGRHCVEPDDIEAVVRVLKSDYLTTGPIVEEFEAKLAEETGSAFAVSVSSATAALHLSALALGLKPGDVAIVPTMTFLSTANAARYVGADVQFADVDPETGLLTPETLSDAKVQAGSNARAVFPVHINGQTADMRGISEVIGFDGRAIVEDASHALGGTHLAKDGKMTPVGSNAYSDMTIFSFHPVKSIAMGEGGAITTNNSDIADKLRVLRNISVNREPRDFQILSQAFDKNGAANPWYYEMESLGFNYRASALHCGLGLSQLGKLKQFTERRSELIARYHLKLKPLAPMIRPLPQIADCVPAWHLCVVLIDFESAGVSRAQVMRALYDEGIGTQVHYIPVHRQPYYKKLYGNLHLPGADAYYNKVLSLPLFVSMNDEDVDHVVAKLQKILGSGG